MAIGLTIILVGVLLAVFLLDRREPESQGSDNVFDGYGSEYRPTKGGVNNPGYLICANIDWKGVLPSHSGQKFDNFDSMRNGIRAWCINLYGKVHDGRIKDTNQMIDILTPAGKENSEIARNNYKASVARANSWGELCRLVFEFENNPSWRSLTTLEKTNFINQGLQDACQYIQNKYHITGIPQYTLKPR